MRSARPPGRLTRPALLAICLQAAWAFPALPADGLEERQPKPDAPHHQAFRWTSKGGLRFSWCLPPGYRPPQTRNLTVILHGTGLDYRWGHANNRPGLFRPADIVVSVDGTSPGPGDSRLFLGKPEDAGAFRDFLLEMRALFSVGRIYLYGHSQGGFFVVYFAGEHPDMVAGVVAHNSGAWNWTKETADLKKVAIAFMHGTADPVVPFPQSPSSRDYYRKKGYELVRLKRLERYNHWPNAVRANEALGWCEGMTTPRPEEALEAAVELLRPKGLDEYQWQTAVDYSGARDVLRRFEGKGPAPFKSLKSGLAARAKLLIQAIENEGKNHVAAIGRQLQKKKAFQLDGQPWLGHLVAVREDFRGVASVEALLTSLRFDETWAAHQKAAGKLLEAWYGNGEPKVKFQAVLAGLPQAFLFEGFPPDLVETMAGWKSSAKGLEVPDSALAEYRQLEAWKKGWDEGLKEYAGIWKAWKPPRL